MLLQCDMSEVAYNKSFESMISISMQFSVCFFYKQNTLHMYLLTNEDLLKVCLNLLKVLL